jgi:uncharacterized protein YbjT (DUF2867 family)
MNLVVGATGYLGSEICRLLREKDKPVRAMVRGGSDPERVRMLTAMGAETVEADLTDRESLDAAVRGAASVLSSATQIAREADFEGVDLEGQKGLIDAARKGGVDHFIYVSLTGGIDVSCPLERAKRTVETHLRESGVAYSILRPSYFMEAWLGPATGFDYENARVRVYGDGASPISFISLGDVAKFAVACVDNPAARDRVLELGGPEAVSPLDAVRIFEEVAGRPFEVEHMPVGAIEGMREGASSPLEESFATLMLCCAHGDEIPMDETLREFPVRLTSVRDYAQRVAAPA